MTLQFLSDQPYTHKENLRRRLGLVLPSVEHVDLPAGRQVAPSRWSEATIGRIGGIWLGAKQKNDEVRVKGIVGAIIKIYNYSMDYQRPSEERGSTEASRPNVSFQPGGQEQDQVPVQETPKTQNISERLRPYRWRIAIVGGIIIALLFGAYSYAKYVAQQKDAEVARQAEEAQKKIDEIIQKRTQDPTATWKTYINTKYRFEIKYPGTWNNLSSYDDYEKADSVAFRSETESGFDIFVNQDNKTESLDQYLQKADQDSRTAYEGTPSKDILNSKNISILGLSAIQRVEQLNAAGFTTIQTYLKSGSEVYTFRLMIGNDAKPYSTNDEYIYNQILSTFKFTDSNYQNETGILTGHVTIGPNCPVERPGVSCTPTPEAYTSRQVMVYKADGTTIVTTKNFDTQGNYSISLPVGTYVVKSKTGIGSVSNMVGAVTIQAGKTATLNFSIDTGIR